MALNEILAQCIQRDWCSFLLCAPLSRGVKHVRQAHNIVIYPRSLLRLHALINSGERARAAPP